MPRIRLLPDRLVSQIAAGEVVERPASVVKELVENALDASAQEIRVELESGGKRRVRVADDGIGMGRDDALLAFDRHATSKIADFEDLLRVATLGFRGEALSSIAAVAKVDLLTADSPGDGWSVRIEGGEVVDAEPAARSRGTTVDVRSLFFNVPARRKFLKRPETELRRCVEVLQGYCLACPDVRYEILHEGRVLVDATPVSRDGEGLRRRIGQLFGRELAESLIELPAAGGPEESIAGFVGPREGGSRSRRRFVFVNGRLIRDRQVLATFYRVVRDEWRTDDFPPLFLFLGVPPEDLDVNVHPQKAEVRFRDRSFLDRVAATLREGLRGAPGEADAPLGPARASSRPPLAWTGLGSREPERWGSVAESGVPEESPGTAKIAEATYRQPTAVSVPLSGGGRTSVRILGQYKGALVLLEAPDSLLLVDQHAAHERILYEELARAFEADEPQVQRLLVPRLLELSPAERMCLDEMRDSLADLGFEIETLSGTDVALAGVPASIGDDEAVDLLTELASSGSDAPDDPESVRREILDALAASGACRSAIKIHRPLPMPEVERLVEDLFACRDPWACPHGRPTILEMTDADLERRFERR